MIIIYKVPKWARKGLKIDKMTPKKLRQVRHLITHWRKNLKDVLENRITNDMRIFVFNVFNIMMKYSDLIPENCTFHLLVAEIEYSFPSKSNVRYLIENDYFDYNF